MSNECDTLGDFLKLSDDEKKTVKVGITGILPDDRKKAEEAAKATTPPELTNGVAAPAASTATEVGAC